eukprot:4189921-Amphidinium_carterae.1
MCKPLYNLDDFLDLVKNKPKHNSYTQRSGLNRIIAWFALYSLHNSMTLLTYIVMNLMPQVPPPTAKSCKDERTRLSFAGNRYRYRL